MTSRFLSSLSRTGVRRHASVQLAAFLSCVAFPAGAQTSYPGPEDDFTQLSLEDLASLSFSAAAKRSQPLFETPAAVSVVRPADLYRYGHVSTAEALRMVPGVHVIDQLPGRWSIATRGGNGIQSTKLLVLVDGRSVYSPFYGAVEWVHADLPMEDLDRVEVVRGPGATLWGANAVNGIINVISKDARDTLGGLVSFRSGTGQAAQGYARWGGKLSGNTWYRVTASGKDADLAPGALEDDPLAGYREGRLGVRTDSVLSDDLHFTCQFDHLRNTRTIWGDSSTHQMSALAARLKAADVWAGDFTIQMYYDTSRDRVGRSDRGGANALPFALNEDTRNFDLDLTHHRRFARHDLTWGGGARHTRNSINPSPSLRVAEPRNAGWLFNAFVQDEIALTEKQLRLTLGSKLEHHTTVDWLVLPNARLLWLPSPKHSFWAAVSRAARAPSRGEREVQLTMGAFPATATTPPVRLQVAGSPDYGSEINKSHELGWRWRPTPRFSTDVTAYYFAYHGVRTLDEYTTIETTPAFTVVQEYRIRNGGTADNYGAEGSFDWRVSDGFELSGGVARGVARVQGVSSIPLVQADHAIPDWIWHAKAWFQLPRDLEFSTALYRVGDTDISQIPGYLRLDAQLVWRPRPDVEVALGVQNATDPRHNENLTATLIPSIEVRRNVYVRVQWRY